MKNSEHFGELTSRMNHFREEVLDKKPYICAKRALLATEAYKEHLNEPPIMKRAYMLKNILEKMPIYIEEDTLIVGNQASSNRDAPIFPEYTMEFVMNELDLFEKRDGDVFYITEETKEELRSIAPFWENNNLRSKGGALLPDEVSVYMETGFFGMEGKLNSGDAHLAVDYQQVLQKGLKGYEERVKDLKEIIYAFLTIFLYLLKCPQSLILSALRAFCFCGKPHISRSIFLYFLYQTWLKSW